MFANALKGANRMRKSATEILQLLAIGGFWIVVIGSIALTNLPYSPLSLSLGMKLNILKLAPEAWAFFTRDPRLPHIFVYRKTRDHTLEGVDFRPFQMRHVFGLDREPRILSQIFSEVADTVPAQAWIAEKHTYGLTELFPEKLRKTIVIKKFPSMKLVCGEYVLKKQAPPPWGWRNQNPDITTLSHVVAVEITCT